MRETWNATACIVTAISAIALGAGAGIAAQASEPDPRAQVEKRIVIDDGKGPGSIFVWTSDGDESGGGAYLGVGLREETGSPDGGARVTTVVPDSPADKAGLEEDDVIVGLDGKIIRGPLALTERVHAAKPGDKVSLDLLRGGKRVTLQVELGERTFGWRFIGPDGKGLQKEKMEALEEKLRELNEKLPPMIEDQLKGLEGLQGHEGLGLRPLRGRMFWLGGRPKLGVELVDATPELREHLGGKKDAGVLVGKVLASSAAEVAGIKVGDLIVSLDDESIRDAGDLIDAVSEKAGKTVSIGIVRDGRTLTVSATLPDDEKEEVLPTGPRADVRTRATTLS